MKLIFFFLMINFSFIFSVFSMQTGKMINPPYLSIEDLYDNHKNLESFNKTKIKLIAFLKEIDIEYEKARGHNNTSQKKLETMWEMGELESAQSLRLNTTKNLPYIQINGIKLHLDCMLSLENNFYSIMEDQDIINTIKKELKLPIVNPDIFDFIFNKNPNFTFYKAIPDHLVNEIQRVGLNSKFGGIGGASEFQGLRAEQLKDIGKMYLSDKIEQAKGYAERNNWKTIIKATLLPSLLDRTIALATETGQYYYVGNISAKYISFMDYNPSI